jgi:hypothetical protein
MRILFNNFDQLTQYLSQQSVPSTYVNPLTATYIVDHTERFNDEFYNGKVYNGEDIRIHELNCNGWCGTNVFGTTRYVGGIDLWPRQKDNTMEITYSTVNDGDYAEIMQCVPLSPMTRMAIFKGLINYAKFAAKKHNLNQLQVDVHQSLRLYNKYYKQVGFTLTDQKATGNHFWIKTFLKL